MIKESEKRVIERACMRKGDVHAIAAYGSRVAGYAREDSDYDVLLALEKFDGKVKYSYETFEGLNLSILIVDKLALIEDVEQAKLGEFVAGRLLNPYLPIMNEKFWREMEIKLKKRVIVEEFEELVGEFGSLTSYMFVPLEYFLFSKLKKRATIYPPALYSYAMTYSCKRAEANLKMTIKGFEEAAAELEEAGLVKMGEGRLAITEKGFSTLKKSIFAKKLELASRGIKQYLVHGSAGRVGLDVVFKEAFSKVSRSFYEMPENLKEPRSLLKLAEGILVFGENWFFELKRHFGLAEDVRVEMKPLGSFYSTTYLYRLKSGSIEKKVVVKRFLDIRSLKWLLVNIATGLVKRFEMKPMIRMGNEYVATIELRKAGVGTPRIILVHPKERLMVKEFVDGSPAIELLKAGDVGPIAKAMASVHKMGYSIGDTKPENMLINRGVVYFVDLEQAKKGGDMAWDVAEFLYYSSWFLTDPKLAESVTRSFVNSYDFDRSILKIAASERYALPFKSVANDEIISAIKKVLKSIS